LLLVRGSVGEGWVLSFQELPAPLFAAVRTRVMQARGRIRQRAADYLLHASITSFADTKRTTTAYGNTLNNYEYTLRVAYKLLDAQAGGSLTGDVVKATRTEQANANSSSLVGGIFDDLLDDAARQITASLRTRRDTGRIAAAKPAAKAVTITLAVEAAARVDSTSADHRVGGDVDAAARVGRVVAIHIGQCAIGYRFGNGFAGHGHIQNQGVEVTAGVWETTTLFDQVLRQRGCGAWA
jgi:hypothetical protein